MNYRSCTLLLAVIAGACSKDTAGLPAPVELNACVVRTSLNIGPVLDQNGPYYHQVVIGSTTDGVTVTNRRQLLDHASVPDGVRLPDGRVLVYYVNGERGLVWIAQLTGDSARGSMRLRKWHMPRRDGRRTIAEPEGLLRAAKSLAA